MLVQWTSKMCPFHISKKNILGVQVHFNSSLFLLTRSVCAVVYHGFNLSTSSLGINVYVSFFVSAAIEIPAYVMALFLVEAPLFGRRRSTAFSLLLGGVACLLTMFVGKREKDR